MVDDSARELEALSSPQKSWEELIEEVDAKIPSPEQRAERILNILKKSNEELTNWDMICFCINYLALSSQAFEWLEKDVKVLGRLIYNAHYAHTKELGLLDDTSNKIISLADWKKR